MQLRWISPKLITCLISKDLGTSLLGSSTLPNYGYVCIYERGFKYKELQYLYYKQRVSYFLRED